MSLFWLSVVNRENPEYWRTGYAKNFNSAARLLVKAFHAHRQAALVVTDAWAGLAALVEMIEVGGAANYTPVDTRGLKVRIRYQISMGPLMRDPITREIIPKARAVELETRQRFDKAMAFFERWETVWADIKHRLLEDPVPEPVVEVLAAVKEYQGDKYDRVARYFLDGNQFLAETELRGEEWGFGTSGLSKIAGKVTVRLVSIAPAFPWKVGYTEAYGEVPGLIRRLRKGSKKGSKKGSS